MVVVGGGGLHLEMNLTHDDFAHDACEEHIAVHHGEAGQEVIKHRSELPRNRATGQIRRDDRGKTLT